MGKSCLNLLLNQRKMKKYFFIVAACSLLLCCKHGQDPEIQEDLYEMPCSCGIKLPQDETACQRELPWDYPVKPGMEEWDQMKIRQERLDACQIPDDVLSSLSTEDLTDICMENPLLITFVFRYSLYDRGLDTLFKNLNGFRELFKREDALRGLLNWYGCAMQNLPFLYSDASDSEKGGFTLKIMAMEFLFTRYHSQNGNTDDYREILRCLICGYENKLLHPVYITRYDLGINLLSRAHQIVQIDEQNHEKIPQKVFSHDFYSGNYDEPTRILIDELSCQIVNSSIISR